jgi:hypothetical protein
LARNPIVRVGAKAQYASRVRLPAGAELLPCGARAVIVSDEMPEVLG